MAPDGNSPWYLAYKRLLRNRLALASLALFFLIVVFVLAAPLWANHVADTGPNTTHTTEKIVVNGEQRDVVSVEGKPVGPVWFGAGGKFFLGADSGLGRDEMVRLMYGGRTSIFIALTSALITTILATVLGLLAGYHRGWIDAVITRTLDVIWSFPVVLLGIALGTALAVGGLKIGPLELAGNSLWIPILIIAVVYTPYMARPIRGEVLALREKEFVEAAVSQGAGSLRVMFGELLPNLWSTVIVFFTLNIANNMLLEASLSFLGAGVQPPNSSWGKMVSTGVELIYTAPLLAFAPGVMILLTVLSLNVFGDGLRDALDPKSKVRLEARAGLPEPKGTAV
ncbi:MAG: ABC-type dipeptide/oligopeptide/nickel transport system, permease component [Solirubrobacterales bacterium]|nr:ABC-type dipeptide/oligopeptide/nickel transport system, permease component [Solirubrobacterales bacterium]